MDLSEFVETSLTQILSGIRAAQKTEGGVGAQMHATPKTDSVIHGGTSGMFTIVEFDVSVVVETGASGKGGLRVWSIGAEAQGEHSHQRTSRVKFGVQLKIPQGDSAED